MKQGKVCEQVRERAKERWRKIESKWRKTESNIETKGNNRKRTKKIEEGLYGESARTRRRK